MMQTIFSKRHVMPIVALALSTLIQNTAHAKGAYQPNGDCAGLPKINISTPAGFCVGLVAEGFKFPRGVLPLANGDILLVDMGGWVENHGTVWRLRPQNGSKLSFVREKLLSGLDRPHGIAMGPDGNVYVGTVNSVIRFSPDAAEKTKEDVIGGNSGVMPLPDTGRHPLKQLTFDAQKNLFVSVGSATDNCAKEDGSAPDASQACPETLGNNPRGVIRKYTMQWPGGKVVSSEIYASGLRNPMALAFNPNNGDLWQGENSRDAINQKNPKLSDAEYPHEELNLIKKNAVYGWPYCFDNNQAAPEYAGHDCKAYTPPTLLLPPHAAPLGLMFYKGKAWPSQFQNNLIVTFHGYRNTGHRLMAYPLNSAQMPENKPVELMGNWGNKKGTPMGAPVDIKQGAAGEVYITEDRNGTVLRLTYTAP